MTFELGTVDEATTTVYKHMSCTIMLKIIICMLGLPVCYVDISGKFGLGMRPGITQQVANLLYYCFPLPLYLQCSKLCKQYNYKTRKLCCA